MIIEKAKIKKDEREIPAVEYGIEKESIRFLETVMDEKESLDEYFEIMADPSLDEEKKTELLARHESLKRANGNIRQAYFTSLSMTDESTGRWQDVENSRKKRRLIPAAPSNTAVDISEKNLSHFAGGLNIYKILLILFVGSFVGVVIEVLWCLLRNGYIESRAGLVWGPFNLLYGVGGVALTLALYSFRNHRRYLSFLGGMVIGSAVEYACSFVQEFFLGSRSWDYSDMPFNINGRICLLYSVFWGFLGVLWIKNLYPRLASIILKIPDRIGRYATVVLTVFLVLNAAMTCIAVYRWAERKENVPAKGIFWETVDERFDDDRMRRIFANMDFGDAESEENKK